MGVSLRDMASLFDELKKIKRLVEAERSAAETRLRDKARTMFDQFYREAKEAGWEDHQVEPIRTMEKAFRKEMLKAS